MTWVAWSALALAIVLGTAGQLLLKHALRTHQATTSGPRRMVSPAMLGWVLCYGLTTILWLLALRSIPLSQAFPLLGLQFALIPLAGARLLEERVTRVQWLGIIAIVAGVALVGQS